eukprot:TRINITY_DN1543_c0_g3_i1.p1 TRINITY_DN1543_c0_g3~~TRINITY_DN1543_c0_g3_i1.p1  ORF type:complete len:429 (-),score=64.68 TRINITY_DN1543_c0_g3_i1:72-1358(-)
MFRSNNAPTRGTILGQPRQLSPSFLRLKWVFVFLVALGLLTTQRFVSSSVQIESNQCTLAGQNVISEVGTRYPLIESCQLQPPELKERIRKDFHSWPVIKNVTKDGYPISLKSLPYCSMILKIVDNELYIVEEKRGFPMRAKSIKMQLHDMLKRYKVPDVQFCVNIGDRMANDEIDPNSPCFVLCKYPQDDRAVVIPDITFGAWPDVLPMDYLRERKSLYKHIKPWEERSNKLFFAGTGGPIRNRLKPMLEFFPNDLELVMHEPKDNAGIVPLERLCDYNYLFHFEGVSYSSRMKYLMMCNSTVIWGHHTIFRPVKYIEFWYDLLIPYKNYIPFEPVEKENLADVLKFLRENEEKAREIAYNGYKLTLTTLSRENIECYWQTLLKEYGSRIDYKPILEDKNEDIYTNLVYDEYQMKEIPAHKQENGET